MKTRLHKLEIQNFKAFRDFSLNLEGRHLLVYGANGSGKSSLYWALYTFFQSARKRPSGHISKYFDASKPECLLNIHEQSEASPTPGKIALTFRHARTKVDTTYPISEAEHGTFQKPEILKADLASDFITYRFFFGFSHFRNSQKFNLWPLFEKEILPFCVSTSGKIPEELWSQIDGISPNPNAYSGYAGTDAYASYHRKTAEFAGVLEPIVESIRDEAQKFYEQHFSEDDPARVTLVLKLTQKPGSSGGNQVEFYSKEPIIELGVKIGSSEVKKPQSFLNEAKMTQIALSIRFAASLTNLHQSDIKLLVLDDLLVSLDMNNRMKVVEILLSETFSDYQKIILTHDHGFFEEFRRMIASDHPQWCFRSLQGDSKNGINQKIEKDPIERATDYLHSHDLEEAAIQLRKAAESTADTYLKMVTGKTPKPGDFHSLSEKLKKARKILANEMPIQAFNEICKDVPTEHRGKLIAVDDADLDGDGALDSSTRDRLKNCRQRMKNFMTHQAWSKLEAYELLDQVLRMKDRVLNPASHWNDTPLYQAEVQKALKLIQRLEQVLTS